MPDTRTNRGAHPKDAHDFADAELGVLRRAAADYAWLLSRDYSTRASLKLVGDRHRLRQRQRQALQRCVASADAVASRRARRVEAKALRDQPLHVDGYNVLLTVESALGGGVVFHAFDGTARDLASMQGHYRRVHQTLPALELIGRFLETNRCRHTTWYLDRPVSNSSRLRGLMLEVAEQHGWPWSVELVPNPDHLLKRTSEIIATADSAILDSSILASERIEAPGQQKMAVRWVNLAWEVVQASVPEAWVVDLQL